MPSQLQLFTPQQESIQPTSLPAEPPASPTPSPVAKKAPKTRATSGRKCEESLPNSGPLGFFSRTFLTLSALLPTRYSETWKTSDTNAGRLCTALRVSERRTGEKDSSSWPTPDAAIFNDGQSLVAYLARKARELSKGYNGNGGGTPLAMAAAIEESKLWPSPSASDSKGARRSTAKTAQWTSKDGETILDAVLSTDPPIGGLWASPIARNAHGAKGADCKAKHAGQDLVSQAREAEAQRFENSSSGEDAPPTSCSSTESSDVQEAEMWPTPRSSEYKGVGPLGSKSHDYRLEKHYLDATVQDAEQKTGALNPAWVEQLMNFPPGWTTLED